MFDIEDAVTNLTRQSDDSVCNAVAAARVRVDRIHNPSDGAPLPVPGGAQDKGATGPSTRMAKTMD